MNPDLVGPGSAPTKVTSGGRGDYPTIWLLVIARKCLVVGLHPSIYPLKPSPSIYWQVSFTSVLRLSRDGKEGYRHTGSSVKHPHTIEGNLVDVQGRRAAEVHRPYQNLFRNTNSILKQGHTFGINQPM